MPPIATLSMRKKSLKRRHEDATAESDAELATSSSSNNDGIDEPPIISSPSKQLNANARRAEPTFLVGIDFGTTMTSVSYYKFKLGKRPNAIHKNAIRSVIGWPNAANGQNRGEVPSESLYLDGEFYWGYGVKLKGQESLSGEGSDAARRPIKFAKLLLADSLSNKDCRVMDSLPCTSSPAPQVDLLPVPYEGLTQTLRALGKDVRDVIRDYLVKILLHTKDYLVQNESFRETSKVELALSVPAGWPFKASWALQEILKESVEAVKFGQGFDLFFVNEPEAASALALDQTPGAKTIQKGETFLVCDAGGGTVDITTYTVDSKGPFRFSEAVPPDGGNFGSVYVNLAIEDFFRDLLKDNEALERKQISAEEQIVHTIIPYFENHLKRVFDISNGLTGVEHFVFHGLEADDTKGIGKNRVIVQWEQVFSWYQKSLRGIVDMIEKQLAASRGEGRSPEKIMLVGGYSQSPTLRHVLKTKFHRQQFLFHSDWESETLVSRGAVYRAFDKSQGPARYIMANFGLLQNQEYDKEKPGHRDLKNGIPRKDPRDQKRYALNCINWIIKKGRLMKFDEHFHERLSQQFKEDEEWVFSQRIYYSVGDDARDDYELEHPYNEGCETAGLISADLTQWKEAHAVRLKGRGKNKYYEISYDVRMELHGRNLKVSLVYPPGEDTQNSITISIAALFQPGTE